MHRGLIRAFFPAMSQIPRATQWGEAREATGESTSRGWSSSTAGAEEDTAETFVDRVFLTVFWILVEAAFLGFRT